MNYLLKKVKQHDSEIEVMIGGLEAVAYMAFSLMLPFFIISVSAV